MNCAKRYHVARMIFALKTHHTNQTVTRFIDRIVQDTALIVQATQDNTKPRHS
jgi:hypothetical protein